jgi:hypothetical protein
MGRGRRDKVRLSQDQRQRSNQLVAMAMLQPKKSCMLKYC